jgi:hypothetical protein
MDLVFRALFVAIVVAGLAHSMESLYRSKALQRREDEASKRPKASAWKGLD